MSQVPGWQIRGRVVEIARPLIMGILNPTPDSFSDGAQLPNLDAALARATEFLADGADIIDVGGESTRPGATPVSLEEELNRVIPVIEQITKRHPDAVISVDTVKSGVARAAIESGAHIVNDVSGLRLDRRIASVCASSGAGLVLMHSRGDVAEMGTYAHATYDDIVSDVFAELRTQLDVARDAGVRNDTIAIDPGIGFSKRSEHSLAMLAALPRLVEWGYPILVGVSRKRFIGEITGVRDPAERLAGTLGANTAALALGARIFRVHDVRPAREALDVAWRILGHRS